jgi:asparagine synthetase B (glutamine-hydrolysing)
MGRATPVPTRHRFRALEACIGVPWGEDPFAPPLPESRGRTSRQAFESAVLVALQRPPCLVAFSGGRDSSTVLGVAARVARTQGLALPIAITHRFPGAIATHESEWQELVMRHLGLEDWVRLEWTDELDLLGPFGQRLLRRHGPLMPFNAHFLEPLLEHARGGALMTGAGGDEIFGPTDRPILSRLLFRRGRPSIRRLPALARELAPRPVRIRAAARRLPFREFQWLREEVRERLVSDYAADAAQPLRWDDSVRRMWRSRYLQCALAAHRALGADHDVALTDPFCDPLVLSTYASAHGAYGPGRRAALSALAGDVLPRPLLSRRTKAGFDEPFFNRYSRSFVREWAGRGVDERLVDIEALRAEWRLDPPAANSYTLMQHAWLSERNRSTGVDTRSEQREAVPTPTRSVRNPAA